MPRARDSEKNIHDEDSLTESASVRTVSADLVRAIGPASERPRPSQLPTQPAAIPVPGLLPRLDPPGDPAPDPDPSLPSPELLEAILREESRGSVPPRRSDAPLPKVSGLPDLTLLHDAPDDEGVTRLRPSSRPPPAPEEDETLLYVPRVVSPPAPGVVRTPPPPPSPVRRRASRGPVLLVVVGLLLALAGVAYAVLR